MNYPKYLYDQPEAQRTATKRTHTISERDAKIAKDLDKFAPLDIVGKMIPLDEIESPDGLRQALLPQGLSLRTQRKGAPIVREINGVPTNVALLTWARGMKPAKDAA